MIGFFDIFRIENWIFKIEFSYYPIEFGSKQFFYNKINDIEGVGSRELRKWWVNSNFDTRKSRS